MRSATTADLPEVVSLFDALDAVYGLAPATDIELLRGLFQVPGFDSERNTWLIATDGGELAGYGDVEERPEEGSVAAFGRVHPDHRGKGLGRGLLSLMESRASAIAAGRPLTIRTSTIAQDERALALLGARGYRHVRDFLHMERSLDDLGTTELPPGVAIRSFQEGDGPLFHSIESRAFHGQWGVSARPFQEWEERHLSGERFQPEACFLAEHQGRPAGMLIGRGWTVEAWVDSLGVLEKFRGHGIGGALLEQAFRVFQETGYRQVALNVDSANPTGAKRFYEGHGMHVRRHWVVLNKPLPDSMPPYG
ncbi:MAG: mycothiol synthase [Actinomycetota bacterium]|nr:mycothiol synthase [Actinomycetota bacterium]